MTINGKPFSEQTFKDEMEKTILKAAADEITAMITSKLSPAEARTITLKFKGTIDNFGVEIDGPEDTIAKAEAALREK